MASKLITLFRPLFQSEHVRSGVHTLEHPRFEPLDEFIGLLDS
jgi:hypothetical protein